MHGISNVSTIQWKQFTLIKYFWVYIRQCKKLIQKQVTLSANYKYNHTNQEYITNKKLHSNGFQISILWQVKLPQSSNGIDDSLEGFQLRPVNGSNVFLILKQRRLNDEDRCCTSEVRQNLSGDIVGRVIATQFLTYRIVWTGLISTNRCVGGSSLCFFLQM